MSSGRRKGPRNSGGGRGGRRGQNIDKAAYHEGTYANARFINATLSTVGCIVQVKVRNGSIYEGILKTFSPKLEVVLEMAHKVDETTKNAVPSRERLIEKLIFNCTDIVSLQAHSVDLDYASKDSFIDSAISKLSSNGQQAERELQPWDGGESSQSISLEDMERNAPATVKTDLQSASENGWDVTEMFETNKRKFNIGTTYDPTLLGYTTQLKTEDTQEFRQREERAAKLANEIERSEQYKARIELENGDGDEEDKFSAVIRENNVGTSGKYVPPHLRGKPGGGGGGGGGNNRPPRQQPPTSQSPGAVPPPGQREGPPSPGTASSVSGPPLTPTQALPNSAPHNEGPKVNGDKNERHEDHPAPHDEPPAPTLPPQLDAYSTASIENNNVAKDAMCEPSGYSVPVLTTGRHDPPPQPQRNQDNKKREEEINDLRAFGNKFKLSPEKDKKSQAASSTSLQPHVAGPGGIPLTTLVTSAPTMPPPQLPLAGVPPTMDKRGAAEEKGASDKAAEGGENPDKKLEETVKKSTLNPNAKEFVMNPNAKPFTPKQQPPSAPPPHPMPVATPPRPTHMQSPVLVYHQAYPPMSHPMMQQQPQPQYPKGAQRKTAVVSVQRQEYNPAEQAAAATGQPIIAPQQPYTVQVYGHHMQGHIPQLVQMPGQGARMVAPHGGQQQQVQEQLQQQGQVYSTMGVPGATAVPAHLGAIQGQAPGQPGHGNSHVPPIPAHMAPHHQPTPSHSQPSHMGQQQGSGHPAPSPVHQHSHAAPGQHPGSQQHPHPGGHPGSQGPGHPGHPPGATTPQLIMYNPPQLGPQPTGGVQHPPLQPSPHTPTSPQSMYPALSYGYTYTSQPAAMAMSGMSQVTLTQAAPHGTPASHPHMHQSHMGPPGQQVVMVPPATQMQQQQQQQQMQHHQLHQHHMQGAMQAQAPSMIPQQPSAATINVSSTNQMPPGHPQMHYAPVPSYILYGRMGQNKT